MSIQYIDDANAAADYSTYLQGLSPDQVKREIDYGNQETRPRMPNPFSRHCCMNAHMRAIFKSGLQWSKNREFAAREVERLASIFPDWKYV